MKKTIYVLFALLAFLSGCKEAPDYGDAVFMTGTLSTNSVRFLVDGQSSLGLTVTSSAKTTSDVKVEVAPAPELLEQYNKTNGTSYQLPPDDS